MTVMPGRIERNILAALSMTVGQPAREERGQYRKCGAVDAGEIESPPQLPTRPRPHGERPDQGDRRQRAAYQTVAGMSRTPARRPASAGGCTSDATSTAVIVFDFVASSNLPRLRTGAKIGAI